jgi:hypothetical protein
VKAAPAHLRLVSDSRRLIQETYETKIQALQELPNQGQRSLLRNCVMPAAIPCLSHAA